MHVKKGDQVFILAGKDRGKTGQVLRALPKENRVLVEGVNVKKVHERPRQSGKKGQIVEKAFPIHVSNVKLVGEQAGKKIKPVKAAKSKK